MAKAKGVACGASKCTRQAYVRGLCKFHYERKRKGIPLDAPKRIVRANPKYSSGEWGAWSLNKNGYRNRVRKIDGRIERQSEHRLVMEQMLGRKLLPGENVHHKNGQRADNRPANLELWITSQPNGQRACDLVAWAHEILGRYDGKL